MPTPTKGPRLGGSPAHEQLILANLATALFKHGRITTTETKAKRLRPLAERLITKAKRDDLAARREVRKTIGEKDTFVALFEQIAPRFATPSSLAKMLFLSAMSSNTASMIKSQSARSSSASELAMRPMRTSTSSRGKRPRLALRS